MVRVTSALKNVLSDPARAVFVVGCSALLAVSLVGLPLAISGLFVPLAVVPPSLIAWPLIALFGFKWMDSRRTNAAALTSWSALAIAIAFGVFVGVNSSEHLLTDRDPGVYFITGKWLATHGDLLYDPGLPEDIQPATPNPLPQGLYEAPNGKAYFQFQHAPAVVLAMANWIGGDEVMFKAMALVAVIALLGLCLVGRGLAGPLYGVAPVFLVAVHPAFIHVGKDGYSEFLRLRLCQPRLSCGSEWTSGRGDHVASQLGFSWAP